ncbi:unnamed protein product [Sphagnum balticum]
MSDHEADTTVPIEEEQVLRSARRSVEVGTTPALKAGKPFFLCCDQTEDDGNCFSLRGQNHQYWYTAGLSPVKTGVSGADIAWNYCDLKCLYLEQYNPGKDFVVISFTQSIIQPNFAACYVQTVQGSKTTNVLWDDATSNSYYEANCGGETEDYYELSLGNNPKYTVTGTQGVGIGTEITYS